MTKKASDQIERRLLSKVYSDPRNAGKHILIMGKTIHVASTGAQATKIFMTETKKHPGITPLSVYVPKADTLILLLWP